MAENPDIVAFICAEIERIVGLPPGTGIGAATDMTADVSIDSVAVMDLVFSLEEKYDISVPLNALGDVRTVGELAALAGELKDRA